jgi:hypothetical protein
MVSEITREAGRTLSGDRTRPGSGRNCTGGTVELGVAGTFGPYLEKP